jgi:ribose 1,5-bisphosphokinase PhnN
LFAGSNLPNASPNDFSREKTNANLGLIWNAEKTKYGVFGPMGVWVMAADLRN